MAPPIRSEFPAPGQSIRSRSPIPDRAQADGGTVEIGDVLDANTSLFTGEFRWRWLTRLNSLTASGAAASGVSLNFTSLGDGGDGVTFLNGANASMTPTAGFDPTVAAFQLQFDGAMNGNSGGANPSFTIRYRVQIE